MITNHRGMASAPRRLTPEGCLDFRASTNPREIILIRRKSHQGTRSQERTWPIPEVVTKLQTDRHRGLRDLYWWQGEASGRFSPEAYACMYVHTHTCSVTFSEVTVTVCRTRHRRSKDGAPDSATAQAGRRKLTLQFVCVDSRSGNILDTLQRLSQQTFPNGRSVTERPKDKCRKKPPEQLGRKQRHPPNWRKVEQT